MKRADLVGTRFGQLVVIGEGMPDPSGNFRWRCKCDCGGENHACTYRLRRGKCTSCGCKPNGYLKDDEIIGRKFGTIEIMGFSHKGSHRDWFYFYKCKCGDEGIVRKTQLRKRNGWKSGCPKCRWKDVGELSLAYFHRVGREAKERKLELSITPEEAWNKFLEQNRICALSGEPLVFSREYTHQQTASLDRIDSSLGYVSGNIQWVHKKVNQLKWDLSTKELLEWCETIVKNYDRHSGGNNI